MKTAGHHKKGRLLLAEDDELLRETMVALLEEDFEVRGVATVNEAIHYVLFAETIDLVVSDFDFHGGLDGGDIARKARERFPLVPILLVTGRPKGHPGIRRFLEMPLTACLEKPIKVATLMKAIDALLER